MVPGKDRGEGVVRASAVPPFVGRTAGRRPGRICPRVHHGDLGRSHRGDGSGGWQFLCERCPWHSTRSLPLTPFPPPHPHPLHTPSPSARQPCPVHSAHTGPHTSSAQPTARSEAPQPSLHSASSQPPRALSAAQFPPPSLSLLHCVVSRLTQLPAAPLPRALAREPGGGPCPAHWNPSCHQPEGSQPACACLFLTHSEAPAEGGKELAVSPISGNDENSCSPPPPFVFPGEPTEEALG